MVKEIWKEQHSKYTSRYFYDYNQVNIIYFLHMLSASKFVNISLPQCNVYSGVHCAGSVFTPLVAYHNQQNISCVLHPIHINYGSYCLLKCLLFVI